MNVTSIAGRRIHVATEITLDSFRKVNGTREPMDAAFTRALRAASCSPLWKVLGSSGTPCAGIDAHVRVPDSLPSSFLKTACSRRKKTWTWRLLLGQR